MLPGTDNLNTASFILESVCLKKWKTVLFPSLAEVGANDYFVHCK